MDQIVSDLKLSELKQGDLGKAYQKLHSQASSFLLLSLQWKDLEEHYETTRKKIQTLSEELEAREKVICSKEDQLVSVRNSISECFKELSLKESELGVAKGLVVKYDEEVRSKNRELVLAEERLHGVLEEIEMKDRDLNLVSMKIEDYAREIEIKENMLCMVIKRIEDSEKEFVIKEKALGGIAELIEKHSHELNLKENQIVSVRTLVEEHDQELQSKEKQYDTLLKEIKERSVELKQKEMELVSIESLRVVKWKEKRLDFIDTNIKTCAKELESKEKELQLMDINLKRSTEETKTKEKDFNFMEKCIEKRKQELDMKEEQLQSTQSLIKDCDKELGLLREQLDSIQKTIMESSHLDSVQESVHADTKDLSEKEKENISIQEMAKKCLNDLKFKQKHYSALKLSIEEQSQKLEMKEQEFKKQSEDLAAKEHILNCLLELSKKRLADSELKEKNFDLLKNSIAEQCKNLEEKEKQFEEKAKELEIKEKELGLLRDSMEKGPEEEKSRENASNFPLKGRKEQYICCPANNAVVALSAGIESGTTKDGNGLVRLLCEHLRKHDSVLGEIANALQTSSHPAELVLDAMRWFYPSDTMIGDMECDKNLIQRSCFILLAQLMKVAAQITAPVKKEALKLARVWKTKMKSTNETSLEALQFLYLLANYGLGSAFNLEELESLLMSLSDYKQAAYLHQALGIAARSPISATLPSVKMEQHEVLEANTGFNSVLENKELSTKSGNDLTPNEISITLQMSLDPAKNALDVFQGFFSRQWRKGETDSKEFDTLSYMLEQLVKMSPDICPQVKEDAMKLALEWRAKMESHREDSLVNFLQFLGTYGLISSFRKDEILKFFEIIVLHKKAPELFYLLGFTKKIFDDLIQYLITSNQVCKVIKVIFAFKLVGKFQPVQILKDYLASASNASRKVFDGNRPLEEKVGVLDTEITVVKDVIQCITDCNLESEFQIRDLRSHISFLENLKVDSKNFKLDQSTKISIQMKDDENHAIDTPAPKSQKTPPPTKSQGQNQPEMNAKIAPSTNIQQFENGGKKRRRSPVRPNTLPNFTHVQIGNSMSSQYENRQVSYERQGPFGFNGSNVRPCNNLRVPQHPNHQHPWHRSL